MFFRLGRRVQDSQNQYYIFLETPEHSKYVKKIRIFLKSIIYGNIKVWAIEDFENDGKVGPRPKRGKMFKFFDSSQDMFENWFEIGLSFIWADEGNRLKK